MIKSIINDCQKPITAYIGSKQVWQNEWTPSQLFKNGEQGVWLDPSDLSTMFQDMNGAEPVTKDGDPVGLILDKSQGTQAESLLDTSYPFEMLEGTIREGEIIHLRRAVAGITIRARNLIIKKGATYRVSFYVESLVSGGIIVPRLNNSSPDSGGAVSKVGYYETYIRSSEDGNLFQLNHGSTGIDAKIRDISVQEVKGNHATQATASARPIYRTDGELHWLEFDGVDDGIASNDFGLVQPHTYAVASTITSIMLAGTAAIVDGSPTSNSSSLIVRSSGVRLYAGAGSFTPPTLEVGKRVFIAKFNGDNSTLLNNGIAGAVRQVGSDNPRGVTLGALASGSFPSDSSIYGFISISKVTTNTEDLAVNTYLANKSGVTL